MPYIPHDICTLHVANSWRAHKCTHRQQCAVTYASLRCWKASRSSYVHTTHTKRTIRPQRIRAMLYARRAYALRIAVGAAQSMRTDAAVRYRVPRCTAVHQRAGAAITPVDQGHFPRLRRLVFLWLARVGRGRPGGRRRMVGPRPAALAPRGSLPDWGVARGVVVVVLALRLHAETEACVSRPA